MSEQPSTDADESEIGRAGLYPDEIAQVARMTDILNQAGFDVLNVGNVTGTKHGIAVNAQIHLQTLAPSEDEPRDETPVDDEEVVPINDSETSPPPEPEVDD